MNRSIRDLLPLLPAKPATRGRAKACVPRDQTKSGCCNSAHPNCGVKPGNDPSRQYSSGSGDQKSLRIYPGSLSIKNLIVVFAHQRPAREIGFIN
jgi:hypothetical protein